MVIPWGCLWWQKTSQYDIFLSKYHKSLDIEHHSVMFLNFDVFHISSSQHISQKSIFHDQMHAFVFNALQSWQYSFQTSRTDGGESLSRRRITFTAPIVLLWCPHTTARLVIYASNQTLVWFIILITFQFVNVPSQNFVACPPLTIQELPLPSSKSCLYLTYLSLRMLVPY